MTDFDDAFEGLAAKPDTYFAMPGLNWSTLKLLNDSPRALIHAAKQEREDTEWMLLGRAIHCWALERDQFRDRYVLAPAFGDLRTKEGKANKAAFMADLGGREMLTAAQAETLTQSGRALAEHKEAARLLEGKREHVITWTHPGTGITCKGKLDVASNRVVDLKSDRGTNIRQILYNAASRLYHGQAAWYDAGARFAGMPMTELPANVFVQNCAPFDVVCAVMTEETYEVGQALWERLISRYDGCREMNWWPGMAPELVNWTLPKWAREGETNE